MKATRSVSLRAACVVAATVASAMTAGCASQSGIYDGYALHQARRVAVLPGLGAPGMGGENAGAMQSSVVITSLANCKAFDVEGPGRLRKAITERSSGSDSERDLQASVARDLGIDLLVLPDVTDYRFEKEWKSSWWYFGSSTWTETTYIAGVNVRIIDPDDGRLVYAGSGQATSKLGYGPAVREATETAMTELKQFLAGPATAPPTGKGSK